MRDTSTESTREILSLIDPCEIVIPFARESRVRPRACDSIPAVERITIIINERTRRGMARSYRGGGRGARGRGTEGFVTNNTVSRVQAHSVQRSNDVITITNRVWRCRDSPKLDAGAATGIEIHDTRQYRAVSVRFKCRPKNHNGINVTRQCRVRIALNATAVNKINFFYCSIII